MLNFGRTISRASRRSLNLQEYHSKDLLNKYGLNVQKFAIAGTGAEANAAAERLMEEGAPEIVLKAQILAGGRGKGHFIPNGYMGGVKLSKLPKHIGDMASKMLGQNLVTKQTTKDGVPVSKVMVAHALDIEKETYLAILMDRESGGPVIVASPDGGMDIEKVAEETPERIFKLPVDINDGISEKDAIKFAECLDFGDARLTAKAGKQICRLYEMFLHVDATQVEINPFGLSSEGEIVCFDAKVNFDDCAKFRQEDIFALGDTTESDPREVEAEAAGLNYIQLDGNIACLVNGAGLAMGTMDLIKLHGGEPANFLDLGGGVTEAGVLKAFEIITRDDKVESILVNIFGGIVDCATIANGIINAYSKISINVPLVVRLEGTNVDAAREILANSGLNLIAADGFDHAARLANEVILESKQAAGAC